MCYTFYLEKGTVYFFQVIHLSCTFYIQLLFQLLFPPLFQPYFLFHLQNICTHLFLHPFQSHRFYSPDIHKAFHCHLLFYFYTHIILSYLFFLHLSLYELSRLQDFSMPLFLPENNEPFPFLFFRFHSFLSLHSLLP